MNIPMNQGEVRMANMFGGVTQGDRSLMARLTDSYIGRVASDKREAFAAAVHKAQASAADFDVRNRTAAVGGMIANAFMSDSVLAFTRRDHFQHAKSVMQGYISAMPAAREAALAGRIRLYGEDNIASLPAQADHSLFYRDMRQNMAVETETGMRVESFVHELPNEYVPLSDYDRANLHATERSLQQWLDEDDIDPTDPWNRLMD